MDACLSTAVTDTPQPADARAWPVPADHVVNVAWSGAIRGPITYTIMDGVGRLVQRGTTVCTNDRTVRIDVSALNEGTYILRLEAGGRVRSVHLVK